MNKPIEAWIMTNPSGDYSVCDESEVREIEKQRDEAIKELAVSERNLANVNICGCGGAYRGSMTCEDCGNGYDI